jgi:putative endonuclease
MNISTLTTKEVGNRGEETVARCIKDAGFQICERNFTCKVGEIDIIAKKAGVLHLIEVKTVVCDEFPEDGGKKQQHSPADNIHSAKILKISKVGQWYMAKNKWTGPVQITAALVWVRRSDFKARVVLLRV